eukprot:gene6120-6824_t
MSSKELSSNKVDVIPLKPKPPPKPKPQLVHKPISGPVLGTKDGPQTILMPKPKPVKPLLPVRPLSVQKKKDNAKQTVVPDQQNSSEIISNEKIKQLSSNVSDTETSVNCHNNNNDVDSCAEKESYHPLSRTMSGPVSPHSKEAMEAKTRSISMRNEEVKGKAALSSRPTPKPRNISKVGKPKPPPRLKKISLHKSKSLGPVTVDHTHCEAEEIESKEKGNSEQHQVIFEESCASEIAQNVQDNEVKEAEEKVKEASGRLGDDSLGQKVKAMEEEDKPDDEKREEVAVPEAIQVNEETSVKEGRKEFAHHGYENVVLGASKENDAKMDLRKRDREETVGNISNENDRLLERREYENVSFNQKPSSVREAKTEEQADKVEKIESVDIDTRADIALDFKHLRIDAEDYDYDNNNDDDEYAVPLQRSAEVTINDLYSFPSKQKKQTEESQSLFAFENKMSPGTGAKKSLFPSTMQQNEVPEQKSKRIRRPPPRPPFSDTNPSVLQSKPKPAKNKDNDPEVTDTQDDQDNIYTTPNSISAEKHASDYENTTQDKPAVHDKDADHVYKEPSNCQLIDVSPTLRRVSDARRQSDFSCDSNPSDHEYVEPGSFPKLDGFQQASNSDGVDDNEYIEVDQQKRPSFSQNKVQDESMGYANVCDNSNLNQDKHFTDSSDEYVDMSDHTPSGTPIKGDRPISHAYLQPVSTSPEKKHIIPARPAPPRPLNLPRPLPTIPIIPPPTEDQNEFPWNFSFEDSESAEDHYERICSLRRQMGMPGVDEDFSDSGSDSEEDDRSKDAKELTDDGKSKGKLYHIANEIFTTEKTFVNALKLVCEDFGAAVKQMLEKDPTSLPKNAYIQIFSDIELICELDKKFLQDLGDRMKEWDKHQRIGDVIREYSHFLKMYTNYIRSYDKTMAVFQEMCQKMPKFAALVKEYERKPSYRNLKITSFMLRPIQRIPSYRLLLVDYLKHLPHESEDYEDIENGLKIVSTVANQINESMKEGDKFQAMLRLQSKIINNKEMVKPGRYLLKEGVLFKLSRKEAQERMFFLLTDCLLYCESAAGHNQYKLRQELPLADMSLHVPNTIDFIKELTIISTKRSFTLVASTPEERDEWVAAIQNAIDDVSKKIITFTSKLEHTDKPASPTGLNHELGRIAPRWVPDDRATMCSICCRRFTTYNRRHHCRACGEIVCKDCSSFEAPLYYLDLEAARVCEKCYHELYNSMVDESLSQTDGANGSTEGSGTKLKRTPSSINGKFRIVKKIKRDKKDRKTLPSKLTEVKVHEQDKNVSGYLWIIKKKKTKKRWFVLKDHVLYTYKAPSDPAANFTLPVLGYEVKFTGNLENDEFIFQLEHKGLKEPLVYRADNHASAEKWVASLKEATELKTE